MRAAAALLALAAPAHGQEGAAWLSACLRAAATPEEAGTCAEDALRLVCAYAPEPAACRDAASATAQAAALPALIASGARPPVLDCAAPPPPLDGPGCEARNARIVVETAARAAPLALPAPAPGPGAGFLSAWAAACTADGARAFAGARRATPAPERRHSDPAAYCADRVAEICGPVPCPGAPG